MRGSSTQDNEIRNLPENRNVPSLARDLDMLSGETKLRVSQEITSLLNGLNSQIKNAISSATSKRIIPHMQGFVGAVIKRQLERVSSMSRKPQNVESDERNVDENNMQNRTSRSHQNLIEPGDESPCPAW